MKLFSGMQAERLVQKLLTFDDQTDEEVVKAAEKLTRLGPGAIPKLIEALIVADRNQTVTVVEILGALLDARSLPAYRAGLTSHNQRIVQGVCWALSSRRSYDPNLLLDLLEDEEISKARLLSVLDSHKDRIDARVLLRHAYSVDAKDKASLFRIVSDITDEKLIPELLSRLGGKDELVRAHIVGILSRFDRDDVAAAVQSKLEDPSKVVRQAALSALNNMKGKIRMDQLCALLLDPEVDVQNKAVDIICRLNHPDTARHLVTVLKSDNDFGRRAAVEVLNEIGTADNVKELLNALKDDDWWVRSRATDALASIGGPKVVDAVLGLFKDPDEEIRRAAVEIINSVKDDRAFQFLLEATEDNDWWVRERAADALAGIGDKRAVPALVRMLRGEAKSVPAVIRALSTLGDPRAVASLLPIMARTEKEIRIETMHALLSLSEEKHSDAVRSALQQQLSGEDPDIAKLARETLTQLDERYSPTAIAANEKAAQMVEPNRTLLIDGAPARELVEAQGRAPKMDLATLKPGDVIENRYKYIQKIGQGAFGTVILVEDTVVDERLVLKFLNKNIAEDEEMLQRFVHELRNSRKITHKNVIRLYDFLHLGGLYAISMEYFPSHALGAELARRQALEVRRSLTIAGDIATGMAVAHHEDIVHRDLKPANILIDNNDLVKIVDFGVSAALNADTQLTKTGYVIGSPKYMAPEQILGKDIDQRADVYSLGVVLYELLTGNAPYTDGDQMSVMYQHVQGKARSVMAMNPDVPENVSALVSKMMSVDKLKRHQTMNDLKREIDGLLE